MQPDRFQGAVLRAAPAPFPAVAVRLVAGVVSPITQTAFGCLNEDPDRRQRADELVLYVPGPASVGVADATPGAVVLDVLELVDLADEVPELIYGPCTIHVGTVDLRTALTGGMGGARAAADS